MTQPQGEGITDEQITLTLSELSGFLSELAGDWESRRQLALQSPVPSVSEETTKALMDIGKVVGATEVLRSLANFCAVRRTIADLEQEANGGIDK